MDRPDLPLSFFVSSRSDAECDVLGELDLESVLVSIAEAAVAVVDSNLL